jgi:hypothetical protein
VMVMPRLSPRSQAAGGKWRWKPLRSKSLLRVKGAGGRVPGLNIQQLRERGGKRVAHFCRMFGVCVRISARVRRVFHRAAVPRDSLH